MHYGEISHRVGEMMNRPAVADYFSRLIQRTSPKSYEQAMMEVRVTKQFFKNFAGDQVRFLARSFGVTGDLTGQESRGYRFPYGPVAIITPFNFPLEIPALQLMGALYMGNKPLLKVDSKVSVVMEQFLRMLIDDCGLPASDVDFIHCDGPVMEKLLLAAEPRNTLFTGSSRVAERLAKTLNGKVKLEDAGFDWKILGPDVPTDPKEVDFIAYVSDQDAYACSGQKCSAQSILFMHENWRATNFLPQITKLAQRRSLADLTIGPVLTWTTDAMLGHVNKLAKIPGARVLFGGKPLTNHSIPPIYGAIEPTAVFVPLAQLASKEHFPLCSTEVFGPVQVVTEYDDAALPTVLDCLERMSHHLTAAIVSNDERFRYQVLAASVNGTTYAGRRARTTGAPQNHWFGPAGDPRGAGIGSPEAIKLVWSCHREVIQDVNSYVPGWTLPKAS